MKIIRKLLKVFKIFLFILILIFIYSIGVSTYENIKQRQKIKEFKSRAYEDYETLEFYDDTYYFYKVKRVHDYELLDDRPVFYNDNFLAPGLEGDILLTFESPFPTVPVVHHLLSFWFGGHSAYVTKNNRVIQSTGLGPDGLLSIDTMINVIMHDGYDEEDYYEVSAQKTLNYWMIKYRDESDSQYSKYGKYYRNEIMAVRPKFESVDQRDQIISQVSNNLDELIDKALYNFTFVIKTPNKYYCTDLVSRAYEDINETFNTNYNLNPDGFIVSDYDIMLSNDVYLTLLKETKKDGIYVYYLE